MADLIAIGYPDETTAHAAADEARRLAAELIIQPDAIAVISRDKDGSYHVTTSHHPMTKGASWGLFWGFLFGKVLKTSLSKDDEKELQDALHGDQATVQSS
jgi:uncharacterized membrane protein